MVRPWPRVALLTCLLSAPAAQANPSRVDTSAERANMEKAPTLTWELRPSGATLRVHYTVQNRSAAPIYLLDRLLAPRSGKLALVPLAVVVHNGAAPGEVLLTKGFVNVDQELMFYVIPGVRKLDPGASLSGDAELALPLVPWHPNAQVEPLRTPRGTAVLEVGYLPDLGEPQMVPLVDGSSVETASARKAILEQQLVRGEPRPLPAGA